MAQTQYASIGCYDCFNKSSSRRGVLVRVRLRVFRVMWTTFQNINLAVQSEAALLSACEAPKPEPVHVKTTSNSSVVNDDEEAEYCHPTLLGCSTASHYLIATLASVLHC